MKRCPECRRDYYDDSLLYCLDDGTPLLEGPASGRGEAATAIIEPPESHRTGVSTQVFSQETSLAPPRKRSSAASFALMAAGVILLAGFGYGLYQLMRTRTETSPAAARQIDIQTQRLTGDGRTRGAAISPDGKFLVYLRVDEGKESLWIKQIQTGSTVNVVKPGDATRIEGITFPPDGEFVYFNANIGPTESPTIYRVPTLGGRPPTRFLSDASFLAFSADGQRISFRRTSTGPEVKESVIVAGSDGTDEREVVSRYGKQFLSSVAAWSPDGKHLAVAIGDDSLGPNDIVTVGLVSTADWTLKEFGSRKWDDIDELVWHPSGDSLILLPTENAFLPGQVWELSYPSGEYRKITNNLNGHYSVSITTDGKAIVTGELYSRTAVWVSPDLKPENAKQVMPATGDTWGLSWTPDGRIVYVSDQSGAAEVWIMDADGANARQLTNDRIFKAVPFVSPDGKYIVYTSSQNNGQIVRINIDGSNPLVLTKATGADNPHISPDGKWVIYSAYVAGPMKVMRVPIDGGEEQVITSYFAEEPRYSNDGTRFACFVLDQKTQEWNNLAIVPAEGGEPIAKFPVPIETNQSRGPVWTPDDKAITVVVASGERQNLWLQAVDGGPTRQMTNVPLPGISRRAYSYDGKRIALVRGEGTGNAIMITNFR